VRSGEYGASSHSVAPAASIISRTPATLCAGTHADDFAGREGRHQALFLVGEEDFAVHRGIDNEWSGDAVVAQTGDEGGHLLVSLRDFGDQPLAAQTATAQPGHVG
jgi:hypothetical protein